ncbi:MAG: hypothetical protein C5B54_05610 [Acidobacteria bacterium]|nr:MAG: hypothetical protein C5B54_05610 [Acidobacteriota bacterium]
MKAEEFRTLALSFRGAIESQHMGHPDFRVGGKIFATLGTKNDVAMVKLKPEQQSAFIEEWPDIFYPASGTWGQRGATMIRLSKADKSSARKALTTAWKNISSFGG